MDKFLRILFAFLVVIGATGAELRLPQEAAQVDMDCTLSPDGTCPCGMPMPQRGPQPCNTSIPSPVAAPTRTVAAVAECATAADQVAREPKPWPAAWALLPRLEDERAMAPEPLRVDTGPPLLASERTAQLRVFRI
jgi:hypothetical protein